MKFKDFSSPYSDLGIVNHQAFQESPQNLGKFKPVLTLYNVVIVQLPVVFVFL